MKQVGMILVCLLLGVPSRVAAEVVYSTFGLADAYDTLNGNSLGGPTSAFPQAVAQQFVPSASVYLDSVELGITRNLGTAEFSVSVFADNAGQLGDELATANVTGYTNGIVTAQFSSSLVLTSGTNYWLGLLPPGNNELTWHDSLQPGFAQQGFSSNQGASWVTASSDPFPPAAMRVNGTPDVAPDLSLINAGQAWRFARGLAEPSVRTAWTTASFNDTAWDFGLEGFGYDANPVTQAGLLSLVQTSLADMQENGVNPDAFTTVYLRRSFDVPVPAAVNELILQLDYDDSFIAYINGVEVTRSQFGTPGVPAEFDELGMVHESTNGDPNKSPGRFVIDLVNDFPGLLQAGSSNVLAIHGLNATLEDDDFLLAQISLGGNRGASNLGDFDMDGDVDGRDFLEWQRDTNVGDLADWQTTFGNGIPLATAVNAVPEPGALASLFVGTLVFLESTRLKYGRVGSANALSFVTQSNSWRNNCCDTKYSRTWRIET